MIVWASELPRQGEGRGYAAICRRVHPACYAASFEIHGAHEDGTSCPLWEKAISRTRNQ